jgi:hypothetical protein
VLTMLPSQNDESLNRCPEQTCHMMGCVHSGDSVTWTAGILPDSQGWDRGNALLSPWWALCSEVWGKKQRATRRLKSILVRTRPIPVSGNSLIRKEQLYGHGI